MKSISRYLLFAIIYFISPSLSAQQAAALDSLKEAVNESKTIAEKVFWLDKLSLATMNVSPERSDSIGRVLIETAEESRDRKLMVKAYMSNGQRCSYFGGNLPRIRQSVEFYEKALKIAEENKLEEEKGGVLLRLTGNYVSLFEKDKALNYANQAASVIATLKHDSLLGESQLAYGNVYLLRNEKILALRYFLNGLRIAEKLKNHSLMRTAYSHLSRFYSAIEAYDKAIDYAVEAYKQLDFIAEKNVPYQRVIDISQIGNLYSLNKNYDIAISYFQRSLKLADSLNFSNLKIPAYMNLFNQYLRRDQPAKALIYFNSPEGKDLQTQLIRVGMSAVVHQAYGIIYTSLEQYDSARLHLLKAKEFFEKSSNLGNKMYFYHNLGTFYKMQGNTDSSIYYYTQLMDMAKNNGMLEHIQVSARELDTLYQRKGDYKLSREYYSISNLYKDSIETLGKEKELAQEEAADEHQRQVRLEEERAEQDRRRNNIQYLAITFGIFGLFLALIILGMFKVSASLIRALGFFAFLLFFEFIFLIFKKNIHSITHGEPWKDLAFMIGLAALLVPLHHFLEKRVLNYLTSHNRLTRAGSGIRQRIFRKSGSQES